jgi:hypothetical protein
MDKLASKHISVQAFQFPLVIIIPPMLHTHLSSMVSITGHSTKIIDSLATNRTKLFMQSFRYYFMTKVEKRL